MEQWYAQPAADRQQTVELRQQASTQPPGNRLRAKPSGPQEKALVSAGEVVQARPQVDLQQLDQRWPLQCGCPSEQRRDRLPNRPSLFPIGCVTAIGWLIGLNTKPSPTPGAMSGTRAASNNVRLTSTVRASRR